MEQNFDRFRNFKDLYNAKVVEKDKYLRYTLVFLTVCIATAVVTLICLLIFRNKVRRRYGIRGDCGHDCLVISFCTHCALCQMYNQLDEPKASRAASSRKLAGYSIFKNDFVQRY
ncbi:uncharacterized protein LOC142348775 [Convolutriloba macropyga]|uniref:uncharacterized protein LOC142348775 n=1 Tax=Convolutriloba macropyga TaxID=536237 RepID=UPI003F522DED